MVCGGIAINDMPKGWTNKGGLNTRIYNCFYAYRYSIYLS